MEKSLADTLVKIQKLLDKDMKIKYPNNVRMSVDSSDCKDSKFLWDSYDCYNCVFANLSKKCGENKTNDHYTCLFINECTNCQYIAFCFQCENCKYCLFCSWLRDKQYCIFNKEYSKEDFIKEYKNIFGAGVVSHFEFPEESSKEEKKESTKKKEDSTKEESSDDCEESSSSAKKGKRDSSDDCDESSSSGSSIKDSSDS